MSICSPAVTGTDAVEQHRLGDELEDTVQVRVVLLWSKRTVHVRVRPLTGRFFGRTQNWTAVPEAGIGEPHQATSEAVIPSFVGAR